MKDDSFHFFGAVEIDGILHIPSGTFRTAEELTLRRSPNLPLDDYWREPKRLGFQRWLSRQAHRQDSIGDLARDTAVAKAFEEYYRYNRTKRHFQHLAEAFLEMPKDGGIQ